MKWLIASDIHGSALWCRKLLKRWEAEKADRLLLLGDILYHGPRNDLPEEYAPREVISMLKPAAKDIFCVRGNCDTEVDQMVLSFPVMAEYVLLEAAGNLVFATHGHVYNRENLPPLHAGDVLLHGHTHIPCCELLPGNVTYLNPGSVSIPKNGTPHSCMTLEDGCFRWHSLLGGMYMEYALENKGQPGGTQGLFSAAGPDCGIPV